MGFTIKIWLIGQPNLAEKVIFELMMEISHKTTLGTVFIWKFIIRNIYFSNLMVTLRYTNLNKLWEFMLQNVYVQFIGQ